MVGGGVSAVNIAIHALAMTFVIQIARTMSRKLIAGSSMFSIQIMIVTVMVIMLAHLCEVAVWALAYGIVGAVPVAAGGSNVYFAFVNYTTLGYGDILPVDPVIFGSDSVVPVPGTEINIAGEGFGPEPGQVLVNVGGIELQAEIEGWYDLGVRVKVPALALAGPTDAELVLIRGDTAASNPLTIQLTLPVAVR